MFNLLGVFVLYALQRFQAVLPYNPAGMAAVRPICRSTRPPAL